MKKVFLAFAVVGAAVLFAFTTSNQTNPITETEGQKYWIQDWDYNMDHDCHNLGYNCITIIYVDELKGTIPALDAAIASGTEAISDFLYSPQGLEIPITSADREALASGQKSFYPMIDEGDGGTFYRFK